MDFVGPCLRSFNSTTHWEYDLGFQNCCFSTYLISCIDAFACWPMYPISQSRALPSKAMDSYAHLITSLWTFYAVHTDSTTNHNWSISSSPTPLKVGIFMCVAMSSSGGGGGGVGEFLPLCGFDVGMVGGLVPIFVALPWLNWGDSLKELNTDWSPPWLTWLPLRVLLPL